MNHRGMRLLLAGGVALATYSGAILTSFIGFGDAMARLFARVAPGTPLPALATLVGPHGAELIFTLASWTLGAATFALVAALLLNARHVWTAYGAWCGPVLVFYIAVATNLRAGHALGLVQAAVSWLVYLGFTAWAIRRSEPSVRPMQRANAAV